MREIVLSSNTSANIEKYRKRYWLMIMVLFISLLSILSGVAINQTLLIVFGVIIGLITFIMININYTNQTKYSYGHSGEMILRQQLHNFLSDDYLALFGYPLKHGGDIDCVLIGPSGLFVIESKHHNGDIYFTNNGWKQIKIGRGGTAYQGGLKNPSSQTSFALHEVKSYLESKGINTFIKGIITFTNPATNLFLEKNLGHLAACKIEDLKKIILSDSNRKISLDKCEKIEKYLSLVSS